MTTLAPTSAATPLPLPQIFAPHETWLDSCTLVCKPVWQQGDDALIAALRGFRYDRDTGVPAALTDLATRRRLLSHLNECLYACSSLNDASDLCLGDLTGADAHKLRPETQRMLSSLAHSLHHMTGAASGTPLVKQRTELAERGMDLLALCNSLLDVDQVAVSFAARGQIANLIQLCEPRLEYSPRRDDRIIERLRIFARDGRLTP